MEVYKEQLVSKLPLFYPGIVKGKADRIVYNLLNETLPFTSTVIPYEEIENDKIFFTVDKEYFSPNGFTHGVLTHKFVLNTGSMILSLYEPVGLTDEEIRDAMEEWVEAHPTYKDMDDEEILEVIDEALFLPDSTVDDAIFESVFENLKEAIEKFYSWECN